MSELSQSIQDDIRDAEPGWCNAFVECGSCDHRWAAVFPVECAVADLQCSACGAQGQTEAVAPRRFREGDRVRVTNGDYNGMKGIVEGEADHSEAEQVVYVVAVDVPNGYELAHTARIYLWESELEPLE